MVSFGLLLEPVDLGVFPSGAVELAYVVLVASLLGRFMLGGRLARIELFALVLIGSVFAYGLLLGNVVVAAAGTVWLLKPLLAFLAGSSLAGKVSMRTVARIGLIWAILVAVSVVVHGAVISGRSVAGATGIYQGPAQAAHACVLGLLILQSAARRRTTRWWCAVLLLALAVALTQSRHGLVLACLAILPSPAAHHLTRFAWWIKAAIPMVVVVAAVIATAGGATVGRFGEVREIAAGRDYYRLYAATVALDAASENAGLGVGPGRFGGPVAHRLAEDGTYQRRLFLFWDRRRAVDRPMTTDVALAHLLGELGYVGLLIVLSGGAWLVVAKKQYAAAPLDLRRSLLIVGLASLFTFAPVTNGPLQVVLFLLGTSRAPAATRQS
jgi:hypothetical protein